MKYCPEADLPRDSLTDVDILFTNDVWYVLVVRNSKSSRKDKTEKRQNPGIWNREFLQSEEEICEF